MKKLVLAFVAVAAISFASCGNKTANNEVANDSDSVQVDSAADSVQVADSAASDSVAK